jgi:NAD(P)H-flavin reductase
VTGFRSYVDMYLKDKMDETGQPLTVVHEVVNDRWEVCLAMSEKGFQQVSFVNSIATTKVRLLLGSTLKVDVKIIIVAARSRILISLPLPCRAGDIPTMWPTRWSPSSSTW